MSGHGDIASRTAIEENRMRIRTFNAELPFEVFDAAQPTTFSWLFEDLVVDDKNKLPPGPSTHKALVNLGKAMMQSTDDQPNDSLVPAWITYFGQFIDHDITSFSATDALKARLDDLENENATVVSPADAAQQLINERTPHFDLDSVYEGLAAGPAARDGDRFIIGETFPVTNGTPRRETVPGKVSDHDLPRATQVAQIGDKRNDENLIIAQMHLAFLKLHNAIIADGKTFAEARLIASQHYQWLALNEFLPAVCNEAIARAAAAGEGITGHIKGASLPIEFAFACYRFGHSMVRNVYDFNNNFPDSSLSQLFTFTHLSGTLGGTPTLPNNWIIQWHRFVDFDPKRKTNQNRARKIDTQLSAALFGLRRPGGDSEPGTLKSLAARNLLRGYLVGLPTGQAMARGLVKRGLLENSDVLTAAELRSAVSAGERDVLEANGFDTATPLWYYVLAEAKIKEQGERLGPVGSWVVAGTIAGLIRNTPNSVLSTPGFQPTLGRVAGQFTFADLLVKAGVADTPIGPLA